MNRTLVLLMAGLAAVAALRADDIYQANAEGRLAVVQRNAIVVDQDSSVFVYKHFDLKERRVVIVRVNQGSLPYTVERSGASGRAQIVEVWRSFGYKASVTDRDGKVFAVADAFLDFYPPEGRGSLLESVPPRTNLPLLLDGGGADQIDFSDIARVTIEGDHLKVTLRNGRVASGKFLMPTNRPAEARLQGMTERYDPASKEVFDFSLALSRIREIKFAE